MMSRLLAVGWMALALVQPALADGIVRKLPADGSWAEYHTTLKFDTTENIGSVVVRSVGEESVDGKPCRWIELEMKSGDEPTTVYKMLVPEKNLATGFDPVDHAIRIWAKEGDNPVKKVENAGVDLSFAGAMLHAPVEEKESLPERSFPWQKGTIKAPGARGSRPIGDRVKGTLTATTWLSDEVPFGVAGNRVVIEPENSNSVIRLEMTINDFGKDAKSALPDSN